MRKGSVCVVLEPKDISSRKKNTPRPGCEEAYWVNGKFRKAEK